MRGHYESPFHSTSVGASNGYPRNGITPMSQDCHYVHTTLGKAKRQQGWIVMRFHRMRVQARGRGDRSSRRRLPVVTWAPLSAPTSCRSSTRRALRRCRSWTRSSRSRNGSESESPTSSASRCSAGGAACSSRQRDRSRQAAKVGGVQAAPGAGATLADTDADSLQVKESGMDKGQKSPRPQGRLRVCGKDAPAQPLYPAARARPHRRATLRTVSREARR